MQIQIVNDVRTKTFVLIPGYELAFEWVLLQFKNISLIIGEVFLHQKVKMLYVFNFQESSTQRLKDKVLHCI